MTRDRETAEAEIVWGAARELWELKGRPVEVVEVVQRTGLDEGSVRRWLTEAEGQEFEVETLE